MISVFWESLESIRGQCAAASAWRRWLEDDFETCCSTLLKRRPELAASVPCPHACGCQHAVVAQPGEGLIGVCCCPDPRCEDLVLRPSDIVLWELDLHKLARALCAAFGLDFKFSGLDIPNTWQIGSWSADAVPAVLTVQSEPQEFRAALGELVARLRHPLLLFAPTGANMDAMSRQLLASVGADFFALASTTRFDAAGRLYAVNPPGQLFARFTPRAGEPLEEETARKAFALVRQLDSEEAVKPPSLLTVFRLYCIEAKSLSEIARRFNASKATIHRRLEMIRAKTGVSPAALRNISPHLARLEDEFSDSRARRVRPRRLIYDDEEGSR